MNNPITIGIASSVVTEILKFVPFLRLNAITQAITAIVVVAVLEWFGSGKITWDGFVGSLIVALTTYKAVVEPVAGSLSLSSQK